MQLTNVGKGPAVVKKITCVVKTLDNVGKVFPDLPDDWGDLSDSGSLALEVKSIRAEGSVEAIGQFQGLMDVADYKAVHKPPYPKILVFYGCIEYGAVIGRKAYKTLFGMQLYPADLFGPEEYFVIGPPRYNRNT